MALRPIRFLLPFCSAILLSLSLVSGLLHADERPPNVLFIIVDDLNDLPLDPIGKPQVATPNFDRLAARGVTFSNAHCNDPICAPSRSSMLFGLYPQTSGLYWFEDWRQNEILKNCVSLTRHLRDHGYGVFGTGKVYHGNQDDPVYERKGPLGNVGPWPWDGRQETRRGWIPHPAQQFLFDADPDMDYQWEHTFGPLSTIPEYAPDQKNGVPGYRGWTLNGEPWRYNTDDDRDRMPDEMIAGWSAEILASDHRKPFALFTGLVRTHTPLYAPKKYFDRFPLDEINVPETVENDLADTASALGDRSLYGFRRFQMLHKHPDRPQLYKEWLQAYMACVAFIDDQVGTILDALEASPWRNNTVVVLTSDHGFHMGEKESIYKQSLWDGATRIPLIIAGLKNMPQGVTCDRPVSLIDLYPTLNEICGLPRQPNEGGSGYKLDGHSLVPLLQDPEGQWSGPDVVITALPGKDHSQHRRFQGSWFPHFSVRSTQYRYSLCASGEEELYDFKSDPLELKNVVDDPAYTETKASLREQLIGLRDGKKWTSLNDLQLWTWGARKGGATQDKERLGFRGHDSFYLATKRKFHNFEIQFALKSADVAQLRISYRATLTENRLKGATTNIAPTPSNLEGNPVEFSVGQWNRYRVRVAGSRCQVWINGRLHSDTLNNEASRTGLIGLDFPGVAEPHVQLEQIRIREL